ncbi:adenylate kinase [Mycena pura]|uniref:Adenylate kinase n=1 Tax=Mycena pura TaxID=153505 RepID=A0AAD6VTL7_9AGAR|nr:adenylate kinase [Mycena pura]
MQAFRRQPSTSGARRRSIGYSAASHRALPFFLNTLRAGVHAERDQGKFLRLVIFGKPGAGKGTLSARLVKKYDIEPLSTGDLLRQHIAERTEIGQQAEEIVAQGKLLPDDVMLKIVASKLDNIRTKHWILDGFPRTVGQGKLLDAHLSKQGTPLSLVINLDVPDDVILSRISDRWVHLPSGRVYNNSYNPPKVDGFDDETGEPLTKRPDDSPEIFARRLTQFYASTSPLVAYYTKAAQKPMRLPPAHHHQHPHQLVFPPAHRLLLNTLSGTTSDEIWPQLDGVVRSSFPALKERTDVRHRHSLSDAVVSSDLSAVSRGES